MWLPVLGSDQEARVAKAMTYLPDARVSHYWVAQGELLSGFAPVLKIDQSKTLGAWDVYLAYGRGVKWDKQPPAPQSWMHQLPALPPERKLNGSTFAGEVNQLLKAKAEPKSP